MNVSGASEVVATIDASCIKKHVDTAFVILPTGSPRPLLSGTEMDRYEIFFLLRHEKKLAGPAYLAG